MHHVTLTTGHTRVSPRGEVADQVLAACEPLLAPGRHRIPGVMGGYELVVPVCQHGWAGTVYQGSVPVATIGVADDEASASEIWPALVKMHGGGAPAQPPLPWCAVVLHAVAPAYEWLGDFERCLAWAWLEHH
jgi:hypothetical protein